MNERMNWWINEYNKCKDEVRGVNGAGLHTLDVDTVLYIGNYLFNLNTQNPPDNYFLFKDN